MHFANTGDTREYLINAQSTKFRHIIIMSYTATD